LTGATEDNDMPAYAIYRDDTLALRLERDQLAARRHAALESVAFAAAAAIFRRRRVRIAAGMVLAALGALVLWGSTVLALANFHSLQDGGVQHHWLKYAGLAIPGLWVAAIVAAEAAAAHSDRILRRDFGRFIASDDAGRDLLHLGTLPTPSLLAERAAALERASIFWPLAGLAMSVPMTLQAPIICVFNRSSELVFWIMLSGIIAGPAHIALVLCARRYADRLRVEPLPKLRDAGWKALGIVTFISAVPFALLLLIPPIVVFVTGSVFVPASFAYIGRRINRERHALTLRR
jgi:hypothetical protein